MKTMPFPKEYKRVLQRKQKNITIRTRDEVGKYKRNQVYEATDYKGNPFNIKIKILDVVNTKLSEIKIPQAERKRINLPPDAKVDVIRFISKSTEPVNISNYGLKAEEGKITLNRETAEALQKANKELPEGYELIVISGYRTLVEQTKIVEDMEKELKKSHPHNWEELLNKYTGGYEELKQKTFPFMNHRSGNAVDLKIIYNDKEVNLGGQQNDERDQLNYYEKKSKLTKEEQAIKNNRRWLKFILEKHGFKNNPNEWWHWGYEPKW